MAVIVIINSHRVLSIVAGLDYGPLEKWGTRLLDPHNI